MTVERGKYSIIINPGKLTPGEYTCVFTAMPYGYVSTQLLVQESTTPTDTSTEPSSTPPSSGIPSYTKETIIIGIFLAKIILTTKSKET